MGKLKTIIIIAILATLVVLLTSLVFTGFDVTETFAVKRIAITFFYASMITLANVIFYYFIEKKIDWQTQRKKRLMVGLIGSVVVSMLIFYFSRIVHVVVFEQKYTLVQFFEHDQAENYLFTFLFVVIISLIIHLFYFYKALQETKVKEQKIIAGTASAKFDALKNQLDPHFLFNSLNVLTSLIDENPNAAQKFTTSLSKVYRYVLEQKNKELVSVEEELKFARTYIDLLKMRFENSIQFNIADEISNPEAKIVPLSLQLLLENAVKHNAISEKNPLIIDLYEREGNLMLQNNLQHKNVLNKSSGIGLLNIKQRYELLTSREILVQKDEHFFVVGLPMLTKQISIVSKKNLNTMEDINYRKMKRARKKVEKIKSFYGNLTSYVIVIPFLAFVNYFSNGFDFPWFLFPTVGWGIGVLFHYMDTFGYNLFFGKNWEEQKIKEYMDKN